MSARVVATAGAACQQAGCGQPASAGVEFRDMNADGKQEALVIFGNTCTSGYAGSSALLFIRDAAGKLRANFGFPAASADPLPERNGSANDHLRNDAQMPGGCDHLNE